MEDRNELQKQQR